MANDRNDFAPEIRNSAWWSGDSRQAANGRANEVILKKLGLMPIEDLSGVEAVQMGHTMQPVIGRLASAKLGIELKDADYALTHPKESWLRSHFDFVSSDGKTLVEAKNYNAAVRKKFDAEALIIPAADMAQLVHESACHGIDRVVLAVLFGGQNFETFEFVITDAQRDKLIQDMAKLWALVQTKQPLEPETVAQAKLLYAEDKHTSVTASLQIENAVMALQQVKAQIKDLETKEDALQTLVLNYMRESNELVSADGNVLATWRQSKGSKKFDAQAFQQALPDIYPQFVRETPGSRRFLIK
jgi:predicted phage-related endonuclease